jgi:branched-subunit amino acid ABC-type transport system permease component
MAFWLWLALAVVFAIIVALLFSHIRIRIRYSRSGQLDQLVIVIQAAYGLFHYQIILPSIVIRGWSVVYGEKRMGGVPGSQIKEKKKRMIGRRTIRRYVKAYHTILKTTRQFKRWARETMKKVECTRWRLDFRVGTGDAATTAVVTGLLWAVSGCASGVAGQFITLKTSPQSEIAPNYSATEFTVVWEADFRIRVSTIIGSFLKLGMRMVHFRVAMRAWRILMSSPKQV